MPSNICNQVQYIKKWCKLYDLEYIKIKSTSSIKKIHNVLKNGKCSNDINDSKVLIFYGLYHFSRKDFSNMIECYKQAIEKGNIIAINNMGYHYQRLLKTDKTEENINNMKKYYNLVIEKCSHLKKSDKYFSSYLYTLHNLADYYANEGDNENALKYLQMGVDAGNTKSLNFLGRHYEKLKNNDMAIKYFLLGIEQKDKYAAFNLGANYGYKDEENMIKYYKLSFDYGYYKAAYYIGKYYYDKEEYDTAIKYYIKGTHKGDALSMDKLGRHYEKMKDYPKMFKFFQMAIDLHFTDSMKNLGLYYKSQNNYDEMIRLFKMARKNGSVSVFKDFGDYYKSIDDYNNMLHYYEQGVEKNNIDCINKLREYYKEQKDHLNMIKYCEMGINIKDNNILKETLLYYEEENDYDTAEKYILLIIATDNEVFCNEVGVNYHTKIISTNMYADDINENPIALRNLNCMMRFYTAAMDKNSGQTMRNVAFYYKTQLGYNPESVECKENMIKYYELSCANDHVPSMIEFGDYYYDLKDHHNLLKYYNMAIDKGDTSKLVTLALYFEARFDFKNKEKYYDLSAKSGNDSSMNLLGYYYMNKQNYTLMKKYLHMAIDKGNPQAMCNMGDYYRSIKDYGQMKKYYDKAVEKGNIVAMNNYGYYHAVVNSSDKKFVKKYYNMSINKGNLVAIDNLAGYYRDTKDYKRMIIYAQKGTDKGSTESPGILGKYYYEQNDYDNALKYLKIGLKRKSTYAVTGINMYLEKMFSVQIAYENNKVLTQANKKKLDHMINIYIQIQLCVDEEIECMEMEKIPDDDFNLSFSELFKEKESEFVGDCIPQDNEIELDDNCDENDDNSNSNFVLTRLDVSNSQYEENTRKINIAKNMPSKCVTYTINHTISLYNFDSAIFPVKMMYVHKKYLSVSNAKLFNKAVDIYNELKQFMDLNKKTCCVCFENNYERSIATCSHTVCYKCYNKINICPICRGSK